MANKRKNNFIEITNLSGGLYTSIHNTQIPDSALQSVINIEYDQGGGVGPRKGTTSFGNGLSGSVAVSAMHTAVRNDDIEIQLMVSDTKMYWYSTNNKYYEVLKTGLTTGLKYAFVDANQSTGNRMFYCNGVDNMSKWSMNVTYLTSALTGGETSISVNDTTDFPSTGTIIYNGTEIAYTAKTATTFTVASAHASRGADDGVAEAVDDTSLSALPKGNIFQIYKQRLWVSGITNDPMKVHGSKVGDFEDFTTVGAYGTVELIVVQGGGGVKALSVQNGWLMIMKPDGPIPYRTVSVNLTEETDEFQDFIDSDGAGASNPGAVAIASNANIFYAANNGGIKELTRVRDVETFLPLQMTDPIAPTIKDYDFSDAQMIFFDQKILVACRDSSTTTFNNRVIVVDIRNGRRSLSIYNGWNVGSWNIYNGELYFGSSAKETKVFKAYNGFDDDGAATTYGMTTKSFDFGQVFKKKKNQTVAVRGLISTSTKLTVIQNYDDGLSGTVKKVINGDGSSNGSGLYVASTDLSGLYGGSTYGATMFGGPSLAEDGDLRPFTIFLKVTNKIRPYTFSVSVLSNSPGDRWKITGIGFAPEAYDSVPQGRKA